MIIARTVYGLYSLLFTMAAVLGLPYWFFRTLREKKYRTNFMQRLGWKLPDVEFSSRPLWIHAVSVGEVLAAKPLSAALRKARPELPIVLSTVTLTGQALARREVSDAAQVFYFPFDWDFSVDRFLEKLRPCAVILMESELWPNFLKGCSRRRIPVFVANGRISDRSLRRYRRVKKIMKYILRDVDIIGVQTHEDRQRFLEVGAREDKVQVTGNLKFDLPAPLIERDGELIKRIRCSLAIDSDCPVIVVGSSMKGEEALFLEAFRKVRETVPLARLILAPRHPDRFDEVADLLRKSGIPFLRRTDVDGSSAQSDAQLLLLDSIGELRAVYALASVAVIGGSFLPYGGHNPLEPAAMGKAIVFGPEMSNFRQIKETFLHERAAREASLESLSGVLTELLQNPRARDLLAQKATRAFWQNQGATQNTMELLLPRITRVSAESAILENDK